MGRLTVTTFVSVDGVMQGPGGPDEDREGGFANGGWTVPHFDHDVGAVVTDLHQRADMLLLGRKTYEIFVAHWPHVSDDDPIAAKLNAMPKFVASRTLDTVDWNNATLIAGDVAETVAGVKVRGDEEILVVGSGNLVQTLVQGDLVDVFQVLVFPALLGEGKRLFADGTAPRDMRLVRTMSSPTGVLVNTYERGGPLTHGSFALDDDPSGAAHRGSPTSRAPWPATSQRDR